MSEAERRVQQRLTEALIAANPTTVTLTPHERVRTDAGGFTWEPREPRDPVTVHLAEPGAGGIRRSRTVDGVEYEVDYLLVAQPGTPIAARDTFTLPGDDPAGGYQVLYVYPPNGYETRAEVTRRAES